MRNLTRYLDYLANALVTALLLGGLVASIAIPLMYANV